MDRVVKKLFLRGDKEYLSDLKRGDEVYFKIKHNDTFYKGVIQGIKEDGVIDILESTTAPAGNHDIDIIVPEEKLYAC